MINLNAHHATTALCFIFMAANAAATDNVKGCDVVALPAMLPAAHISSLSRAQQSQDLEVPVTVTSPNGGEKLFTGTSYPHPMVHPRRASRSANSMCSTPRNAGATFTAVPGCTALASSARTCAMDSPRSGNNEGRIRITATDGVGNTGSDSSDANFRDPQSHRKRLSQQKLLRS